MKTLLLLATVAAATAVFATSSHAAGIFGCTKDVTVQGHLEIIFCGPAEATVHVGSHSRTIRHGSCVHAAGRFAVNVGISAPDLKPIPNWVSLTTLTGPHTGVQRASVTVFLGGKGYAVSKGTITIAADGRHGSFAGLTGPDLFHQTIKVVGTFTCS